MDRLVVLVDAGYLLSQAVKVLSNNQSRSRAELQLNNASGLVTMLVDKAKSELQNQSLLRVYWYDGVKNGLSVDHKALVAVNDVQLRAGTVNGKGQQKGVDSKIVIDLIELATNHAISDAMIVTGDGDLAIGIELSQRRGIRVAVLGVEELSMGVPHSQSAEVTDVADRAIRIGAADLSPYLSYVPKTTASSQPQSSAIPPLTPPSQASNLAAQTTVVTIVQPPQPVSLATLVGQFVSSKQPALDPSTTITDQGRVDPAIDRELMFFVLTGLGRGLTGQEKTQARLELRTLLGWTAPSP
ncbi:NYN domain-containing protein [Aeromonas salmonicida]|uniref:NYN domain-containing protein n=1 Tax=Aeromonas salmonicida TaxID=645 RepID=UPI00223FAF2C|nr:NYN domain-containing protein [Aeromonas salmonicida]